MFDPRFPIEAAAAVPVRDLMRSASKLIDRVERDGDVIALSRHGRLVAVLAPLPEKMMVHFENEAPPRPNEAETHDVEIPEWVEQSDAAQALLLRALETHPMPYSADGFPFPIAHVLVAKSKLELHGFADQTLRGNFLTPAGVAAARMLRRRLDKENPPPPS